MIDKLLESELNSIPEAEFIDLAGEDITDLQKDIDSQMDKIFQEFGGDTNDVEFKINVRRSIPNRGETEHCFSCLPSELPITDRIKEEYGAGAYEIWIYKAGKIFKRRKLNIAKALKQPTLNPVNNNNDVSQLILAMSENNRQNMEQIKTLIAPSAKPPMDILQMVSVGTTLITALKEVLAPPVQVNPMDTFMKAATFMNDMKSEGDKESNAFDMIGKLAQTFGPGIMDMSNKLAVQQTSPQVPVNQTTVTGKPPAQIAQPPVQNNPLPETSQELAQLKQQLGMLVQMAHTGKDPALYADLIMDQVPEEYINKYILRDDVIPFLISVEPNIEHFKEWFIELHKHIDAAFSEDDIPVLTDDEETTKSSSTNESLNVDDELAKITGIDDEQEILINAATKPTAKNQTDSDSSGDTERP